MNSAQISLLICSVVLLILAAIGWVHAWLYGAMLRRSSSQYLDDVLRRLKNFWTTIRLPCLIVGLGLLTVYMVTLSI